ncbi:MAG: amidase domain-containing protein [Lachnospiraceae bacterium]|nr:amidase domain-containing protein [Lachnospiraceae bacterium]
MKKNYMIAITSALAITAAGAAIGQVPAGADRTAKTGIPYEEAIASLYEKSDSITDEEILEIARNIEPDLREVEAEIGGRQAEAVAEALKAYEEEKCSYILADKAPADKEDGIHCEWDRQEAYTMMSFTPAQTLTALLPGISVTDCSVQDGEVTVKVDEWVTQTYTEGQDTSVENVSAYRYYYTCTLAKDESGAWTVTDVTGTDRNFAWMEDAQVQEAMAGLADGQEQETAASGNGMYGVASLELYGAVSYTYNPDKAVAYADKWATSRNPEYRQYPGVDCCNFVSQCLYAGGMPKSDKWYPASYCWINCSGAIAHFKEYGTFMKAENGNVCKGNPVYYDWNSNGVYDHTAICVGKNASGTPIVDAHTGDHYHVSWSLGSNGTRATIQLRGNGSNTSAGTNKAGTWKKSQGSWYYVNENNKKITGWVQYNGSWYYLEKKHGKMHTGWLKSGKTWYFLRSDGKMFKNGWLKISGKYYYFDGYGIMKTGWLRDSGKYYYLGTDGAMQTGLISISGKKYYLKGDGSMEKGLVKADGKLYYFGNNGAAVTGWKTIGGKKYFFSPSAGGAAATTSWMINGKIYQFGSDGVLKE